MMQRPVHLSLGFSEYLILRKGATVPEGLEEFPLGFRPGVEQTLQGCLGDFDATSKLRRFLAEEGVDDLSRWDDREVVRQAAQRIEARYLLVPVRRTPRPLPPVARQAEPEVMRARPAPLHRQDSDWLWLEVATPLGPAEDPAGFLLLDPEGNEVEGKLSAGLFKKPSVARGQYRVQFRCLRSARWSSPGARLGDLLRMTVLAHGLADGTKVTLSLYEAFQPEEEAPLAELEAEIADGEATATWRFVQEVGAPCRADLVFEAEALGKWVASEVLRLEPAPAQEVRGARQRLRQLGWDVDPGAPDPTADLEKALREFQESRGFAQPHGRLDDTTSRLLAEVA